MSVCGLLVHWCPRPRQQAPECPTRADPTSCNRMCQLAQGLKAAPPYVVPRAKCSTIPPNRLRQPPHATAHQHTTHRSMPGPGPKPGGQPGRPPTGAHSIHPPTRTRYLSASRNHPLFLCTPQAKKLKCYLLAACNRNAALAVWGHDTCTASNIPNTSNQSGEGTLCVLPTPLSSSKPAGERSALIVFRLSAKGVTRRCQHVQGRLQGPPP